MADLAKGGARRDNRPARAAFTRIIPIVALATVLALSFGSGSVFAAEPREQAAQGPQRTGPGFHEHREIRDNEEEVDVNVCSTAVPAGSAHCHARERTDLTAKSARPAQAGQAQPTAGPGNNGAYDPSFLQSAYNLASVASTSGRAQVVGIVDAFDDPNAERDLASYRAQFGLPALPTCASWPSTSPCFQKVNQNGARGAYPTADVAWAEEISLDLDMVSAICPNCTILLVEANTNNWADLGAAVNEAVSLGAKVVSNSYGGGEWATESADLDPFFNHPGVAITVSSGDSGYGVEYPAASPYVTAVGGTNLQQSTNTGSRNATETAWTGAGSGCSAFESKPTWQTDASTCGHRTVADVSAVADPSSGVWVYDTYGQRGWLMIGGTSAAAPIIGSTYALAGNGPSANQLASYPYAHTSSLNDIISGTNAGTAGCAPNVYLCTAGPKYDGPTGWGTPNNTTAFTPAPVAIAPAPVVTAISPTHAPAGQRVTITGSHLTGASAVAFGTVNASTFTVNSDSQITTTAPTQPSATTVDVTVTTRGGTSAISTADQFGYDPVINAISPVHGVAGATVTINGANLSGASAVSFGTVAGTIKTVSSTQVTASAPQQAAGTSVQLTVKTPVATSAASSATFTYDAPPPAPVVSSISPTHAAAGQPVTITGSKLTGASAVAFGTVNATTFTVNSDTQITATAPPQSSATGVSVSVTTAGGTATSAGQFGYDPVVTSLSPTHAVAGSTITINGNNLNGTSGVSFGPAPATNVKLVSATQVTATAPSGTVGTSVDVTVTTPIATSAASAADRFTYDAAAVASFSLTVSPSSTDVSKGDPARFTLTLNAINAYASQVSISVAGLPSGTYSISPNPQTPTASGATVTISVSTDSLLGTYPLTITATGADGSIKRANATLIVSS